MRKHFCRNQNIATVFRSAKYSPSAMAVVAVFFATLFLVVNSHAQTLPLGGRTASMGGAGTASGRDSAMTYINPAGYARVPRHTLSLSASLYRQENIMIDDYFYHGYVDPQLNLMAAPSASGNDLISRSFSSFPGAVSMLWHFGPKDDPMGTHHVLGLTMIVPRNEKATYEGELGLTFEDGGTFRSSLDYVKEVTRYLLGPSYSIKLRNVRLGLSLFGSYTSATLSNDRVFEFAGQQGYSANKLHEFHEGHSFGALGILGFQWNPAGGNFALGASFSTPTFYLASKTVSNLNLEDTRPSADGPGFKSVMRADGETEYNYPMRARLGLSYEQEKKWAIALDAGLVLPNDKAQISNVSIATSFQVQGQPAELSRESLRAQYASNLAVSAHLGGEYFFNDTFAMRLGAYYEQDNNKIERTSGNILAMDVDHFGATTGLGIEGETGETTIGLAFDLGRGQTIAQDRIGSVVDDYFRLRDVTSVSFILFVSGAFELEEFKPITTVIRNPQMLLEDFQVPLEFAHIDPSLVKFSDSFTGPDASLIMNNILQDLTFKYSQSGVKEFDELFISLARIRASIEVSRRIITQLTSNLEQLQSSLSPELTQQDKAAIINSLISYAVNGEESSLLDPIRNRPEWDNLVEFIRLASALTKVLKNISDEAIEIPGEVQTLAQTAHESFSGPQVILLPAVARGLGSAETEAVAIVKEMPLLVKEMGGLLRQLSNNEEVN